MTSPLGITITDPDGTKHHYTMDEAYEMGYKIEDLTTGTATKAYKTESGSYTPFISKSVDPVIALDESSGKISVTVPDEWKDDEYVKKLTDNSVLTSLSRNYKADKDVKYQDPFDETKQVTTKEYIEEASKALKDVYAALEATVTDKDYLISKYGGSNEKDAAINALTTDDIIIMHADLSDDNSWVPIPSYLLVAYPQIANLSTFKNGYVQKKDFLDNFYNIESGAISERNASGIASSPEVALAEIEKMTPEEIAKTIAFWGLVDANAPKRSEIENFVRGGSAYAQGFYGGLYDWATDTASLVVNLAKLSWWTGGVDVKSPLMENAFMEGAGLSPKAQQETLTALSYTDPNAATALKVGYQAGELSGRAIDMVLTTVAFGEASKAITNRIVSKGSKDIALKMAVEIEGESKATTVATSAEIEAAGKIAEQNAKTTAKIINNMPAATQTFFSQTMSQAKSAFINGLAGTQEMLNSMNLVQVTNVVNAAAKVAANATLANTAMGIVSNFVLGAFVTNKSLAVKVLSDKATSGEAAQWISQAVFDAAKLTALSTLTNVGTEAFARQIKGTELESMINEFRQGASKLATGVASKLSTPYLKFMKWFTTRKELAKQVSNATANSAEAVREAILVNEMRAFTASQSVGPASRSTAVAASQGFANQVRYNYRDVLSEAFKNGAVINAGLDEVMPFMEAQANQIAAENRLTDWGDISTSEMVLVGELTDPDIEPVISAQLEEVNDANAELLKWEELAGLIDKESIKINKTLAKEPTGLAFAYHSREASVYAVRSHELQIAIDRATAEKATLSTYPEYIEAKARYDKAAKELSDGARKVIDNKVLPALRRAEHSLIDRMSRDWGIYPRSFVDRMRASGRFGRDGEDWLRLVARKDLPKGMYMPYSRTVQKDYTIDLLRSKILDDEDITWVGNGLYELIHESALARMEKGFLEDAKKGSGLKTEIVVSGEKTAAARDLNEYKAELNKAISTGVRSLVEDIGDTASIGKKRDIEIAVAQREVATTGGLQMMDVATVRSLLSDAGGLTTESIVDQESYDVFYKQSAPGAKKILDAFNTHGELPWSEFESTSGLAPTENVAAASDEWDSFLTSGDAGVSITPFDNFAEARASQPEEFSSAMEKIDRINAAANKKVTATEDVKTAAEEFTKLWKELVAETSELEGLSVEVFDGPAPTAKTVGKAKSNPLKYDFDKDVLEADIDYAINGMVSLVEANDAADAALKGVMKLQKLEDTPVGKEFVILENILGKGQKKLFGQTVKDLAKSVVDKNIPKTKTVIKGNLDSLYEKVEDAIYSNLESRLALDKAQLESMGEQVDSETVTELLDKYNEEIMDAKSNPLVVKTTNSQGEIQYERVSPSIADIYNNRPIYTPVSTPMQIFANLGLLKRISTTNLSPRSFSKQAASDTAMAFATTGALPGTLQALRSEIETKFGSRIANEIAAHDPTRYKNIELVAAREGISIEEATMRNVEALSDLQLPFTTINQEALRQANVGKYGEKVALEKQRKVTRQKFNSGLRKVADKLGRPNDLREEYARRVAGEKAFRDALDKGFSYEQAESFRRYAQDNATTNFRQKSAVFNNLRITTPYLTSGISGAKSFWKMFQLDPVGVSARIFTGFVIPVFYFMGEILSDDELKKKYDALAEHEKDNHIVISVGGELIRIPVGEELGGYTNLITHIVEAMHEENKYDFWLLMLNDMVGLYPVLDLTGFTDPEMWQPISGEAPSFLEVMDNGVSSILAATMPPVAQSLYMAISGRDLYTGKRVDTGYVSIAEDGTATIMSSSQSQFAKFIANIIGGDARVIEKVTSGLVGTTALHVLDTVTSAVQYAATGGEEGSLTTALDKTISDITNPYATVGYASLERQLSSGISSLYNKKEDIVNSDLYKKYNQEISREKDPERRQNLINKRNDLLSDFMNSVEALVKGYRDAGGSLDKTKFSKVVSLLTFEDALRADRAFMELNTNYSDAYTQAMQTLNSFGITDPDGLSMLGYIYTDSDGNPQVKMWTPAQIQVISNALYEQKDIHRARIEAIINDGTANSISNALKAEKAAEKPYWNKAKMTSADYDAVDELRKEFNVKAARALKDYMDTYGAAYVLSNDAVMDYLEDIFYVPSSYERINGRYVSSGGGKLNKRQGFAESYIKAIFGVN